MHVIACDYLGIDSVAKRRKIESRSGQSPGGRSEAKRATPSDAAEQHSVENPALLDAVID
ncbi:hypothetical protein RMSM_06523, partial [Rhodopirellula maiorica SM1]